MTGLNADQLSAQACHFRVGQSAASENAKPDKLDAERLRFLCDPGNDWIHMGVMIMHQLCEQFIEAVF